MIKTKLSESDVRLIRKLLKRHKRPGGFICRWFGISKSSVRDIKSGRNWGHVR